MSVFAPAIYWTSRQGSRDLNEDRIGYCTKDTAELLVLADGMGGYQDGDIAAETAVSSIRDYFNSNILPTTEAQTQRFLQDAIQYAHYMLIEHNQHLPTRLRPATTIIVALLYQQHLMCAHAGDSRLYLIRHQQMAHKTKDHAFPPTEEQGRSHRLYSCLGKHDNYKLSLSAWHPLQEEDIILLCSDGVWDKLSDADILAHLHLNNIAETAESLLNLSEKRLKNNTDNMSLILRYWSNHEDDLSLSLSDEDIAQP